MSCKKGRAERVHCEKMFHQNPVPSWDVTGQTLPGQEYFTYNQQEFYIAFPGILPECICFLVHISGGNFS
jgi:hypothetical protein